MNLRNKRILVTGGAGFIGSHLVDRIILERPQKLIIVDNFFLGKIANLYSAKKKFPKLQIIKENAEDYAAMEKIVKKNQVDIIFNLAVKPLEYSFDNPDGSFMNSVKIANVLTSLLRKDLYKTLIHYSSSEAYGTAQYMPMDEKHPMGPTTPYAAGKAAADLLIMSNCKAFGLDISIVRPFNNFGPRQNETIYAAIVPITIKRLLRGKKPVLFWDGNQTRDFIFVKNTVEATLDIYKTKATRGKIINIASGEETAIIDILRAICKSMNYSGSIIKKPKRHGDVRQHCADISLAKKLINFKYQISLEKGVEETVKWYISNLRN